MPHEIDQTRSQLGAFYGRQAAWHGLGTVVPDGLPLNEALKASMTDFTVMRRPAGMLDSNGDFIQVNGRIVTYREDTGDPLGIVGRDYEIIQNTEAFGFLEELVGAFGYTWETMGALYGGRQVFAILKVPNGDTRVGGVDEIKPYVFVRNSHDGSTPITSKATFTRVVCANTLRVALREGGSDEIRIRHTLHARDHMAEAVRHNEHFSVYKDAFMREANMLETRAMNDEEFERFLENLWPEPSVSQESRGAMAHTRWENRRDQLMDLWRSPTQQNVANTLWAAEQTVTEYLDWHQPIRRTEGRSALTEEVIRGMRALEGDADQVKHKTHKLLLERT